MRSKLMMLLIVGVLAFAFVLPAFADVTSGSEEKDWAYPLMPLVDVNEVEPNDVCPGQVINCGDVLHGAISPAADNDYFNFYVPLAGTIITFGTDADGATPVGDTYIYLYNADCTTLLASDDDSGPGLYSLITYTATAPGTYVGRVKAYSSTTTGTYKAFVNCESPQLPPPNDQCGGAIELACGPVSLAGTTRWATNDYNLVTPNTCTTFTSAGKDMTYKFTVPVGSSVSLTYTSTADASFYIVTDCANLTTCLIGADATVSGQPEVINYTFTTAGTYYLILDSYGTDTWGTWTLVGSLTCPSSVSGTTWGVVKSLYR
jgi:hypothetical protein